MLPSERVIVLAKRVITIAMHTASAVPDDDDTAKVECGRAMPYRSCVGGAPLTECSAKR